MARALSPNLLPLLGVMTMLSLLVSGCTSTTPAPVYGWDWSGPVRQGDDQVPREKKRETGRKRENRTSSRTSRTSGPVAPAHAESADKRRARPNTGTVVDRRPASGIDWRWPLEGALVQRFREGDRTHQGIRITASRGDAVHAASAGQVVYSGSGLKGYGNLIIIKHNDKYLSAYGFNRKLFVAEGERVKRGQVVAEVGQQADGVCLLHFEIRRNGVAVDPLLYLPPRD